MKMKKLVSYAWLVIAIAIAFEQQQYVAATSDYNGIDLIQSTCNQSIDYDLCDSILHSDPRSLTASVKGFACIMLDLTLSEAKHANSDLQELLNNTSIDPMMKKCFFTCNTMYEMAINTYIPATLSYTNSGSYVDARKIGFAAFKTVQTCRRELVESKVADKHPKVFKVNKYVTHLTALTLDIIHLLVPQ